MELKGKVLGKILFVGTLTEKIFVPFLPSRMLSLYFQTHFQFSSSTQKGLKMQCIYQTRF